MSIWVFPSGDIHIVRAAAPNTVDIRVLALVPPNRRGVGWEDISTIDGHQAVFRQTPPAGTVQHAITNIVGSGGINPLVRGVPAPAAISPSAIAGTSFHRVIVAGPQMNVQGILRVTTHENVTALAAGDTNVSLYAGESNRVLTVYARFTDGMFEDATGHPWLRYTPQHPALATVDSEGRITGVSAGNTSIRITTWDGRFGFDVPVIVQPALAGPQGAAFVVDELKRKTARHVGTVYVVSESYDDQPRFFDHARRVVNAWIGTQPYKRLADSFHAVGVFRHSFDRHITIGPRLLPAPGMSTDRRLLWEPAALGAIDPAHVPGDRMLSCDTQFGLMAGTRVASTPKLASVGTDFPRLFFNPRDDARSIQVDDRRLPRFGLDDPAGFVPVPPNAAFTDFVSRWLASAGQTLGPNDRVAFLIDEELYAGMNLEVLDLSIENRPMIAITCGKESAIGGVQAFGPLFGRQLRSASLDAAATGSRFAHELAHTYRLADEYENSRRRSYAADDASIADIERHENIQHDVTLRMAGNNNPLRGDPSPATPPPLPRGQLDVTRIKWNIHRIARISPASAIAATASGQRLTLARGQAKRWKAGERAFVRNSLVTPKDVQTEPRTTALDVQIVSANATNDTVEIRLPAGSDAAVLGATPLLYVPKIDGGVEQGLIHPVVLAFLAANGPFPKPATSPCGGGTRETWNNDVECPPISGFKRPSNNADALGLYEGGADISCDVFRPAGRCKMRKLLDEEVESTTGQTIKSKIVVVGFCFVCQYVLVELIDPSKHEGLDNDYPRDC